MAEAVLDGQSPQPVVSGPPGPIADNTSYVK